MKTDPKDNKGKGTGRDTAHDLPKTYKVGQKKITTNKDGQKMSYTYIGNGNWQGKPIKSPDFKPPKMKPKTNYKSTNSKNGRAI